MLLAKAIDWSQFDDLADECYSEEGRPGCNTPLMIGLLYLKYAFDESDESVVDRWVENPYWQFFCGFHEMQHECPINPSSLSRWRKRVGADRLEKMLRCCIAMLERRSVPRSSPIRLRNNYQAFLSRSVSYTHLTLPTILLV